MWGRISVKGTKDSSRLFASFSIISQQSTSWNSSQLISLHDFCVLPVSLGFQLSEGEVGWDSLAIAVW